jgi:hypothetical protein
MAFDSVLIVVLQYANPHLMYINHFVPIWPEILWQNYYASWSVFHCYHSPTLGITRR